MKAKTFAAYVFAATAVPVASWAGMPSGPQGTGTYGAPNGAVPLPQTVPPGYIDVGPQAAPVPDDSVHRDALADQTAIDHEPARTAGRRSNRWVLQGPSWATNPPAPPGS
ncbi:MAG TPA: hypothetical protein VKE95_04225 [Burkholderiales bacterium]|nr:hypothetical protein [Burkholderiales bacterium]